MVNYKKYGMSHFKGAGLIMFPNEENSRYEKFCSLMRDKAFRTLTTKDDHYSNMDSEYLRRATLNPDGLFALKSIETLRTKA